MTEAPRSAPANMSSAIKRNFIKEHVYIYNKEGTKEDWFPGYLAVFTEAGISRVCWASYERLKRAREGQGHDPYRSSEAAPAPPTSTAECVIKIALRAIHTIWKYTPQKLGQGVPMIKLTLEGGQDLPPFLFYNGGVREFFTEMRALTPLHASPDDPDLFYVNDFSRDLLTRSFHVIEPSAPEGDVESVAEEPPVVVAQQTGKGGLTNNVLSLFSTIASTARTTGSFVARTLGQNRAPPVPARPTSEDKPDTDGPQQVSSSIGSFQVLDNYSPVRQTTVDPKSVPMPSRTAGLDEVTFIGSFDSEGKISVEHRDQVRNLVFSGGCHPTIRCEVWKYLLGLYRWDSTHEEREALQRSRKAEYQVYKNQWHSITEEQQSHFRKFRNRKHIIERDVLRTDRLEPFYAAPDPNADNNVYVSGAQRSTDMLHDILLTYSFFNFDCGYCQGMNDYLAPLLQEVGDECEAFWLFKALMDRVHTFFAKDQSGMHGQLRRLSSIIQLMDPDFYAYLESIECENFHFCFRWLLLTFKRELNEYEAIKAVWETIWSCAESQNFQLFVAVAMLKNVRDHIMDNQLQFDGLLLLCNRMGKDSDVDYPAILVSATHSMRYFHSSFNAETKSRALL